MSDERPSDELEPAQAELDLGEISETDTPGEAASFEDEPTDAPPDDEPPAAEHADEAEAAGEPEAEAVGDSDAEAAGESEAEAASDSDDADADDPDLEPPIAEEEDLLAASAAAAEPRRAELPTSWPDPIPVAEAPPPPTRFDGTVVTPPVLILGSLITLAFLLFVAIEPTPRWLLLFAAVVAVLGTDGALRQAWPRPFARSEDPADSTPFLFLPALAVIAWPMLIEHNVRGYLVLPAALLAGGAFTLVLIAQLSSVRSAAVVYPVARLASTAAVYFTAFVLFSLSYVLDAELPAAIAAVAAIAAMLSVELFREGQVDPLETLVFAGVTGVVLAEARWTMYYVPVGGYLGGLALLLGFFLVTGLLHSHLTRRLTSSIALEYAGIAAAGVLLVVIAGQAGLG